MASLISSSSTSTMSSTKARIWAKVNSLQEATAMPSAMVAIRSSITGPPAATAWLRVGAPAASTPTTRTWGRGPAIRPPGPIRRGWFPRVRAAATPDARPPPPTGTTTTSASGASSASSRPMVPCPAMTAASSKGGT